MKKNVMRRGIALLAAATLLMGSLDAGSLKVYAQNGGGIGYG